MYLIAGQQNHSNEVEAVRGKSELIFKCSLNVFKAKARFCTISGFIYSVKILRELNQ